MTERERGWNIKQQNKGREGQIVKGRERKKKRRRNRKEKM
jgi:hypothetical protein